MENFLKSLKSAAYEVWLFLSSKLFLVNFSKMAALVLGLLFLTNWWLKCYTSHGESVQVSDFTGMHVGDAKRKGRDKGFDFVMMDSVWKPGQPGGIIISQTPKPLSRVKEGRKIYVVVTRSVADMVKLPQLKDSNYDFDSYVAKLKRNNIEGKIKEKQFDAKLAPNFILYLYYNGEKIEERDIKNGYEVPMGASLEFVVVERQSNQMTIPEITCMPYSAAEFLVSNSNLNIGTVTEDETVTDRANAIVYKQEPPFQDGVTIPAGSQVNIWLTQIKPSNCGGSDEIEEDGGNN